MQRIKRTFIHTPHNHWVCKLLDKRTHENFIGEGETKKAAYKNAKEKWKIANRDLFDVFSVSGSTSDTGCFTFMLVLLALFAYWFY